MLTIVPTYRNRKALDVCLRQTVHHFIRDSEKLLNRIINKGGRKLTFPIFDNELLSSSKQLKVGPKGCVFTIKQEDLCDYNLNCFISSGFMIDDFIMNILSETVE